MAANFQDDDDFDWEAAVAEIDEACRRAGRASASTSFPGPSSENHGRLYARPSQVTLSQNSFRQRTLDGYLRPQEVRQATPPACHNLGNPEEQDSGIDPVAAATWIYPANVIKREYQFKISQAALFSNTIVSLPTGLGKTLIAAVVMYNYFRWFPRGKIIFTAPSRPLVSQQIEACHNIMGIPQAMTIEMTGHMTPQNRAEFWQTKRVFYVTPQVLEKDIQAGTCPKQLIVCLVVDEAHRATGNYSYCVVVRELIAADVKLRILALTATPGSNQASIQAVVDNLQISLLEHRSDNDPDVRQYIHDRKVEVIQVALSREGNRVKDMLLQVMQPVVKRLTALGVFFTRDYTMNSSYDFHAARNKYRESPPTTGAAAKKEAEDSFALAVTLYNIYKLVHCHGITCAVVMLERKLNEPGIFSRLMLRNQKLLDVKRIMQDCVRHGAPSPKLNKLEEILQDHFRVHNPRETRAIIFTSFRESVKDIMNALTKQDGDVKAMEFVGQSSGARDSYGKTQKGQTQKVQQAVLQKFRAGGYNTLVATSIGEEGLDIMEVDLVVCFDANVSPLRMIQRMGRTGRKRDGRVVVLASEGAELQSYQSKLAKNKALVKHMQNGGLQSFNFHLSPRMVPHRYKPQVQETEMLIEKFVPRSYKQKASAEIEDPDADLTAEECAVLQKYSNSSIANMWNPSLIAFPRFQLVPTPVYRVKHSFRTTSMLIGTLQSLESSSQQLFNREKSRDSSPSDVEIEDLNWDKDAIAWTEDENMGRHWSLEDEQCEPVLFMTPRVLENPVLEVPEIVDPSLVSAEGSQVGIPWSRKESPVLVSCYPSKSERPSPNIGQEDNTPAHMNSSFETRANAEDVRLQSEHILDDRLANKQYLHRCLFSKGFVSVSPTGSIVIASPPTLRDKASDNYLDKVEVSTFRVWPFNSAVTYQMVSSDTDQSSKAGGAVKIVNTGSTSGRLGDGDSIAKSPGDQLMTALPVTGSEQALCPRSGKMGFNSDCKANNYDIIVPSSLRKTAVVHVDPERAVRALDQHIMNFQHRKDVSSAGVTLEDVNFVPASISPKQTGGTRTALAGSSYMGAKVPAAGFFQDKLVESSHTPGRLATSRAFPNDLSPRLTSLAEQGMVPVSPLPETPVMQKHVTFQNKYSQQDVPKEEAWDSGQELQVQCTRMTSSGTRRGLPPSGPVICRGRPPLRSPVQLVEAGGTSPIQPKSLQFNHASSAPLTATEFQRSPLCMGTTGSIQTASWAKNTTPNIPQASHSNEGVEIPTSVAMSVQKPRKFKRLRKVRQVSSPQLAEAGMGTLSIQEEAGQPRNHTTAGVSRRGEDTSKGKAVVRPFVDDEAEASSDDACSSDEEDATEDGEDLTDFIDDATNPSSAPTQNPPIASVDMMAVYRRSLFTPSPAHGAGVAPWMRFAQSGHTPSSDATGASGSSLDTGSCPATAATDRTRVTADSAQKSDPPDTVIETPTFNAISMAKVPPSVGSTYSSKQMPVAQADALPLPVPFPLVEGTADGAKGRLEIRKRKLSFQPDLSEPEAPAGVNQSGQTQQPEQQFQITYLEDDDFFDGLDLDALEAQAVQQSRARQATQQQQQAAFPKHHSLDRHP